MTAWGHAPARLWEMTPRQVAAWAVLGFSRKRGEMAEQLAISAMAARDKPDSLNRQLKEWNDG